MRYVFVMLLCIHALIHLIGVVKQGEWVEAPVSGAPSLRTPTAAANRMGVLWLLTCLTLMAAAALLMQGNERWWVAALGGVLLSQFLVFTSWPQAKAGTAVNVLLGLAIVAGWAHARFSADSEKLARALIERTAGAPARVVEANELAPLPEPVRRWLESAGVVGRPRATSVRLKQRGGLRTSVDQDFMPAVADQYFSVTEPGFVWRVAVPMFHVPILGRDTYLDGKGHMLIKMLGLVPVVDAEGGQIDQGTLLRFLGEMVWFPSAALGPYVHWEALDRASARATMSYGAVRDSADFSFDAQGRVFRVAALRYMQDGDAPPKLERWVVRMSRWQAMNGVVIPVEGDVTWELKSGDFTYYRWQLTELEQNVSALYKDAP